MSAKTTQTLVATASDGTTVTYRTRAGYTVAAVTKGRDGRLTLVAKGFSSESVRSRARTLTGGHGFEVVPFKVEVRGVAVTEIPGDIASYFERKREMAGARQRQVPRIVQTYKVGESFQDVTPVPATYATLRELAAQGVHTVGVVAYESPVADFPVEPILARAGRPLLPGSLIGSVVRW